MSKRYPGFQDGEDAAHSAEEADAEVSLADLRERLVEAQRLAAEAEEKAEEARALAATYEKAARETEKRTFVIESLINDAEARGDREELADLRKQSRIVSQLVAENYRQADDKGRIAQGHDREAHAHHDLADRIKRQIKQ